MVQVCKALCALSVTLILSACSTQNGKFYQHDGPPASNSELETQSAVPKVESFYPASLRPYTVMGKQYVPVRTDVPMTQTGVASWYGKQFHGNKTAIGEIYDMHRMSAAHPTMPLPSYARVTNLANGKSVIVRVNDRGPFLHNRIIDLSYAAASALGYANKGTANVEVMRLTNRDISTGQWHQSPESEAVAMPQTQVETSDIQTNPTVQTMPSSNGWGIQIGFFTEHANAMAYGTHAEAVLASNGTPKTVRIVKDDTGYRVIVGENLSLNLARNMALQLKSVLGTDAFAVAK